jgi:cell division cycle protein 20 (cofactor of APC complex)
MLTLLPLLAAQVTELNPCHPFALNAGGRDALVCNFDVRLRKHEARVATLRGHEQEVCGLKWSPNGCQVSIA